MATVDDAINDIFTHQQHPAFPSLPPSDCFDASWQGFFATDTATPSENRSHAALTQFAVSGPEASAVVKVELNNGFQVGEDVANSQTSTHADMLNLDRLVFGWNAPDANANIRFKAKEGFQPVQPTRSQILPQWLPAQSLPPHMAMLSQQLTCPNFAPAASPGHAAMQAQQRQTCTSPSQLKEQAHHARASTSDKRRSKSSTVDADEAGGVKPKKRTNKKPVFWTEEEHQRFVAALKRFNGDDEDGLGPGVAELIAMTLGSRSVPQVRSHAQKYFSRLMQAKQRVQALQTP